MSHIPKKYLLALLCVFALSTTACAGKGVLVSESEEAIANMNYAKQFQAQGRYELAKQYYLLALSAVQTKNTLSQLERALNTVDMQIKTMR